MLKKCHTKQNKTTNYYITVCMTDIKEDYKSRFVWISGDMLLCAISQSELKVEHTIDLRHCNLVKTSDVTFTLETVNEDMYYFNTKTVEMTDNCVQLLSKHNETFGSGFVPTKCLFFFLHFFVFFFLNCFCFLIYNCDYAKYVSCVDIICISFLFCVFLLI